MSYGYFGYGSYPPRSRGVHFTDRELREILITIFVMTFAFYSAIRSPLLIFYQSERIYILAAFLAVTTAFFFSLIAEKRTASELGYGVEYTYSKFGLALALITGLFGFVLAMPGRTLVYGPAGRDTTSDTGRIFFSGLLTNVVLGGLFLAVAYMGGGWSRYSYLSPVGFTVAWINIILAVFTMLPFHGIPGRNLYDWDKTRYIALWIAIAVLLVGYFII